MLEFHPSFYLVGVALFLLIWGVRFVGGCLARLLQVVGLVALLAAFAFFYVEFGFAWP